MEYLDRNNFYKITTIRPDSITKKFIFTLQNEAGFSVEHTAQEIFSNKSYLQLSPEDAYEVGFTHGYEAQIKQYNEIIELSKA